MHLDIIDRRVLGVFIRKHGKHVEMRHMLTQFGHTKMYMYFKMKPYCGQKI